MSDVENWDVENCILENCSVENCKGTEELRAQSRIGERHGIYRIPSLQPALHPVCIEDHHQPLTDEQVLPWVEQQLHP